MSTALIGYGEMKRREEAAKKRGERYKVDPAVREARAALLDARQAIEDQAEAEAKARQEANPTALAAVLARASIDELGEIARSIGRMDPRKLEEMASEVFRAKARSQSYQPDDEATQETQEAPSAAKASSGRPRR